METQLPHDQKKDGQIVDKILEVLEANLQKAKLRGKKPHHTLRKKEKPTILILTTKSFGKGHLSASKALMEAFDSYHRGYCDVQILDLFGECNRFIDQALKACYDNSIKYAPNLWGWFFHGTATQEQSRFLNILSYPFIIDRLAPIIADINPDLIISTYPPLWNLALERVFSELGITPKSMTVITDSVVVHPGWITKSTDHYMVANEETKRSVIEQGVDPDHVHVFGFPVGEAFEAHENKALYRKTHGLEAPLHAVFMLGTGVTNKDMQLALDIKETFGDQIGLTVITGKNEHMKKTLEEARLPEPIRILGWSTEVGQYMHAADVVITKAGGATVMECIATKTPALITKVIPGQEEGNAATIAHYKIGRITETHEDVIKALASLLRDPSQLTTMEAHLEKLATPNAAKHIMDFAVYFVSKE